jgi:ATP-dependent Lon protease
MYDNFINNSLISFEKFNFFNIFNSIDVALFYKSIKYIKSDDELLNHYKKFGTYHIENVLKIYLGENHFNIFKKSLKTEKFNLVSRYCHPYSFKILDWTSKNKFKKVKHINRNKMIEDYMIVENSDTCECYDIKGQSQNFWLRIYGIKIVFQLHDKKQTLIFNCIVDDILIDDNKNNLLKDVLIYNENELLENDEFEENALNNYYSETIDNVIKDFMSCELYYKRKMIIQLLKSNNDKFANIALLLYDLLNTRRKSYEYNSEKKILSLSIPNYLKERLINHNKNDINKIIQSNDTEIDIPLETKIKMLNVDEYVKSKLLLKLKEMKSKSDDSGKMRQYLDGILSVPFGVYIKEDIFNLSDSIRSKSNKSVVQFIYDYDSILKKHSETYQRIIKYTIPEILLKKRKKHLVDINQKYKYKNKPEIIHDIITYITENKDNDDEIKKVLYCLNIILPGVEEYFHTKELSFTIDALRNSLTYTKQILDDTIYAHENVKREIQRLFSQWITGEQSGYCIGFEGPPGVGKTTIAKYGISECLKDDKGVKRPFNFLSLGGSNNSSLLDGHNYTYVGSTWGKLVDFLMKSKCMNPIIYIDELDKVSKTEHGNEIVGILTHLVDPSQNEHISDKYFSGIPFDFSKVLFIFSYNDASLIDPILLDRIHRIKFNYLKQKEKVVISKKFIIPEIFKKLDMSYDIVTIDDDVINHIISTYTYESGVRKLKEFIFMILTEINIKLLNKQFTSLPVKVTIDDIKNIYLKEKNGVIHYTINQDEKRIYGMWANNLGMGGVLPIHIKMFPNNTPLELKLTGLPGTVMKESMHVSQTLAWSYLTDEEKKSWIEKGKGLHIHCPDGSTNKDGPSAGSAITLSLILFLKNQVVKENYGITGEINLEGDITAIGGLELKIMGSIKAGIKHFIFPSENISDFEKIEDKSQFNDITFSNVKNIGELLNIIL